MGVGWGDVAVGDVVVIGVGRNGGLVAYMWGRLLYYFVHGGVYGLCERTVGRRHVGYCFSTVLV